jgi:hypothetical protein
MANKEVWMIAVGSWGVRRMECTEEEAEEWRSHKANWEHSPAQKIKLDDFIKLSNEEIELNWAYKDIRDKLKRDALVLNGEQNE